MAVLTDTQHLPRRSADDVAAHSRCASDKPRFLALLRELAAWREEEAQRRNLPRNRVMQRRVADRDRRPCAAQCRRSQPLAAASDAVFAESKQGAAILAAIERGLASCRQSECPKPQPRPELPSGIGPLVELLRVLLKSNARSMAWRSG